MDLSIKENFFINSINEDFDGEKNIQKKHSNYNYSTDKIVKQSRKPIEIDENRKSKFIIYFGACLFFLTLISFVFVGSIINFLQLLLLITINLSSNKNWKLYHNKLKGFLFDILLCPIYCLFYYWIDVEFNIKLDNVDLIKKLKEPSIDLILMNNRYKLDTTIALLLANQFNSSGLIKILTLEARRYLPVVDWAFLISDNMFVKRNIWLNQIPIWKLNLNKSLDYEKYSIYLHQEGSFFAEGSHLISSDNSKSSVDLKYHMKHRNKDFNFIVRFYLREIIQNKNKDINSFRLVNELIVMDEDPTFYQVLFGKKLKADFYFEEIKIPDDICQEVLNSKDENDCPKLSRFLRKIYERKDEIVEQYRNNNNEFVLNSKTGGTYPFSARKTPLVVWLVGFTITYSFIGYWLVFKSYANLIKFFISVISFLIISIYAVNKEIVNLNKSDKLDN